MLVLQVVPHMAEVAIIGVVSKDASTKESRSDLKIEDSFVEVLER